MQDHPNHKDNKAKINDHNDQTPKNEPNQEEVDDFLRPSTADETTKENKTLPKEVIEGELLPSEASLESTGELTDKKSAWVNLKKQLEEVLREANVTKRQIYIFLGGVICLVLLIFGVIFGVGQIWKDKAEIVKETEEVTMPKTENDKELDKVPENSLRLGMELGQKQLVLEQKKADNLEPTLLLGIELGKIPPILLKYLSNFELASGIRLGGGRLAAKPLSEIEETITHLRELQEILTVNVLQDLTAIEKEEERRDYVGKTLLKMKAVLEKTKRLYDNLGEQMEILQAEHDSLEDQKNALEKDFFDQLALLSSDLSDEALQGFIIMAKDQTELKARYRALSKIREEFVLPYQNLQKRVTAMELNQEALIKKVQIINVKGSGLELVIEEPKK